MQQLLTPERTMKPQLRLVTAAGKRIGRRIKSNSDEMREQGREADETTDEKTDTEHSLLIYIYS